MRFVPDFVVQDFLDRVLDEHFKKPLEDINENLKRIIEVLENKEADDEQK